MGGQGFESLGTRKKSSLEPNLQWTVRKLMEYGIVPGQKTCRRKSVVITKRRSFLFSTLNKTEVRPDGTVDIRNSYAVPHNESSDQVALDIDYHHNMLLSHQKVNPKEVIVGWFSTGFGINNLLHNFKKFLWTYAWLRLSALVLMYLSQQQWTRFPMIWKEWKLPWNRLLALIDDVYKYVDDVVEGRVAPDNDIGQFISETVASIPKLSPHTFDKLVNDSLQDQLLLLYLSSITRTQLSLAEKLNTAAQIL
ncbi:Eukaryotic translation initiation factor 3 subunit F [Forsythia ovata]|uniref:Eukaryotic translation initiation factor 3 subunit F n=1 Tax=Forsythia ovata TaxID=205694 RepID=A0ABD1X8Q7_9LAMI